MNAAKDSFTTEEAIAMAKQIGLSFDEVAFGPEDLRAGMDVELEHGHRDPRTDVTHDDPVITAKSAKQEASLFRSRYAFGRNLFDARTPRFRGFPRHASRAESNPWRTRGRPPRFPRSPCTSGSSRS
jgi:hypothetical protein